MNKIVSKYPVFEDFKNPNVLMWLIAYWVLTLVLSIFIWNFWAALSFALAAYAVIWNDAVQTLMTYIHSNNDVPRKYLFAWVAAVLLWVIWYWFLSAGDITYGRLDAKWYADFEIQWYITIFPLILVFLTRFRWIPVSTSLLMLSIFSTTLLFQSIVMKSALGYLVAFLASFFIWIVVEYILKTFSKKKKSKVVNFVWMIVKSIIASAVIMLALWYVLIPFILSSFPALDIPVITNLQLALYSIVAFLFTLGIFYEREADDSVSRSSVFWFHINGGPVGNIVTKKTSTNEIISATMIDLIYFVILLIFKEWSNIPMSTTWVFVWLLVAFKESWKDFSKIMVGLGISVMALIIVRYFTGT